jgi:hypothetical protein
VVTIAINAFIPGHKSLGFSAKGDKEFPGKTASKKVLKRGKLSCKI